MSIDLRTTDGVFHPYELVESGRRLPVPLSQRAAEELHRQLGEALGKASKAKPRKIHLEYQVEITVDADAYALPYGFDAENIEALTEDARHHIGATLGAALPDLGSFGEYVTEISVRG